MSLKKLRLYMAGLVAFLMGMPLTERVFAQGDGVGEDVGDLIDMATNLSPGAS